MKHLGRKLICVLMSVTLMLSLSGCSVLKEILAEPTEREYAGDSKPEWSGETETEPSSKETDETDETRESRETSGTKPDEPERRYRITGLLLTLNVIKSPV